MKAHDTWRRLAWVFWGMVLVSPLAAAQESQPSAAVVETQQDPAFRIGKQLRCPVCQGMPIAESPSQMAQDMMQRVRDMVAEGKGDEEILDSFVSSYGEWVLLKPRAQGFNLVVWLLPPLGLLVGVLLVWRLLQRRSTAGVPSAAAPRDDRSEGLDPYLDAIHREVER